MGIEEMKAFGLSSLLKYKSFRVKLLIFDSHNGLTTEEWPELSFSNTINTTETHLAKREARHPSMLQYPHRCDST